MWYPPIEPYRTGRLPVSGGHDVYWEASGTPSAAAVLILHGGPGGGLTPQMRRWFDPRRFHIVGFDQRGCGQSTPLGCVTGNTTQDLVDDIERLRTALGIDKWMLAGWSWGTTLALAYAESHPAHVAGMVLTSVFTASSLEIGWLYGSHGAALHRPEGWRAFAGPLADRVAGAATAIAGQELLSAYLGRLTCGDPAIEIEAALAWCRWEHELTYADTVPMRHDTREMHTRARIQAHYFANAAFLDEGVLLARAGTLAAVRGIIVHGEDDLVTPRSTAVALYQAWPRSVLRLVPHAGHASTEPEMMRALVDAMDEMSTDVAKPECDR